MNIGFLWCNSGSVFNESSDDYKCGVEAVLKEVDATLQFTTYDLINQQFPKSIDENDAYIISGSRFGVYQELDWMLKLEAFITEIHQSKIKCIGICFGHQIIAKTFGGRVEKSKNGWGVGIMEHQIIQSEGWMKPAKSTIFSLVSHQDQVVEIPKTARRNAKSDFCPNYWLSYDNHITTLQGHPEFNKNFLRDLLKIKENISDKRKKEALESLNLKADSKLINQWLVGFLKRD